MTEHQSGLASGLLNTSTQIGGAIGTRSRQASRPAGTKSLLHAGDAAPNALTGGFHQTFWVLGAIALIAPPAVLMLTRRARSPHAASKPASGQAEPALATTK